MMHGLSSPIKYVRLLWREYNGRRLWYAQLICEGLPYIKPQNYVSEGLVGLDLNISNVAFVGDDYAGLLPFADKVPTFEQEIKSAQRKMERSRRASNPDNYEPDFTAKRGRKTVKKKGKPKKGKRQWKQSNHYRKLAQKKRNLERRKTAYAKSQNRQLVNEVLRHGNQIQTERVSVKGWQKRNGKAIAAKSPGFFQSELIRKAASAGGSVYRFPTQTTALSQTHLTGERIKKSLSERVHHDQSGIVMHRDLFSAYLARYIVQDRLSLQDAQTEYPGMESTLLGAWERYQSANRVGVAESRKSEPPSEQIPSDSEKVSQISQYWLKAC
jgi:transposase